MAKPKPMIKLRVVGTTDDFEQLVLSNKPRGIQGSHAVTIDRRLLDVLQEAVYARREAKARERVAPYVIPERIEPKAPPKEIQKMLRSGKSSAEVAAALGVGEAHVERFLQPIIYERIEVINDVQEMFLDKPRLGSSSLPLGDAVGASLLARRVSMDADRMAQAWHATRKDGEPWAVTFTFPYRGRSRVARWKFDPRTRTVEASNALARDIGWAAKGAKRPDPSGRGAAPVAAGSRARAGGAPARGAPKRAAPKKRSARAPAKKSAAQKRSVKKRSAKKSVKKSGSRKAAKRPAKKAPKKSGKRPPRKTTRRAAPKKGAARRSTKAAPRKRSASKPKRSAPKRATTKRSAPKRAKPKKKAARTPARATRSRARSSGTSRGRTSGRRSARPSGRGSARRR